MPFVLVAFVTEIFLLDRLADWVEGATGELHWQIFSTSFNKDPLVTEDSLIAEILLSTEAKQEFYNKSKQWKLCKWKVLKNENVSKL